MAKVNNHVFANSNCPKPPDREFGFIGGIPTWLPKSEPLGEMDNLAINACVKIAVSIYSEYT